MKKKFLLFTVLIITALFLGFTVYYIAKNDETISLTLNKEDSIYINEKESFILPIEWKKPYKDTKLIVSIGDENVLSYSNESKMFTGTDGGFTSVTITTTNKNFGPFVFEVYVGDGEMGSPFMIRNVEELAKIGSNETFTSSKYYALSNDIDMSSYNQGVWKPIKNFSGNFNGNGYIIYNLKINDCPNAGLFDTVTATGVVENVKFADVNIKGKYDNLGVVAGVNSGLVGKIEVISGVLINEKAGSQTGGIVGYNKHDTSVAYVNMCYANITLHSAGAIGGLVGLNESSVVLNSVAIVNEFKALSAEAVYGGAVANNNSIYDEEQKKYYASAIVKTFAVTTAISGDENAVKGAFIGKNNDEDSNISLHYGNVFENNIYATDSNLDLSAIGAGVETLTDTDKDNLSKKTKEDLLNKATYVNFNFDTVWNKEASSYAKPNFLGSYETIYIKGLGEEITPIEYDLISFLKEIKGNGSQGEEIAYIVSKEAVEALPSEMVSKQDGTTIVTYDLNGESWETISDEKNPLKLSIMVDDGVLVKIKNFKLEGQNNSFFGYISGNTIIKNITFENVTYSSQAEDYASVVATALINGATINNVNVENVNFSTNAKTVGLLVAENRGSIINSSVNSVNTVSINSTNEQVSMGAICGHNAGTITGSKVISLGLEIKTVALGNGNFNIGGIAGVNEALISESGVDAFTLTSNNEGTMYVGGIAGYVAAGETSKIYKSYAKANITLNLTSENVYLAGVAAYAGAGSSIYGSAFKQGTLKANNVSGLVGILYGTLNVSYVEGVLHGNIVGGLVGTCYSNLNNCYTLAILEGNNQNSIVSGVVSNVGPECLVDKCFSAATFAGEGERYAESYSKFRMMYIARWILQSTGRYDYGTVSNLIIINHGDAIIQTEIFGLYDTFLDAEENVWIDVTEEDCRGKDGYAVIREIAGFEDSIWEFGNSGQYPTLKDAVVVK